MKSLSHGAKALSKVHSKASTKHTLLGAAKQAVKASKPNAPRQRAHPAAATVAQEKMTQVLLDDGLEMSFPASDPVSIDANPTQIKRAPDMVCAGQDHPLEPAVPSKRPRKSKATTKAKK